MCFQGTRTPTYLNVGRGLETVQLVKKLKHCTLHLRISALGTLYTAVVCVCVCVCVRVCVRACVRVRVSSCNILCIIAHKL
jgi:hypothetical protein